MFMEGGIEVVLVIVWLIPLVVLVARKGWEVIEEALKPVVVHSSVLVEFHRLPSSTRNSYYSPSTSLSSVFCSRVLTSTIDCDQLANGIERER